MVRKYWEKAASPKKGKMRKHVSCGCRDPCCIISKSEERRAIERKTAASVQRNRYRRKTKQNKINVTPGPEKDDVTSANQTPGGYKFACVRGAGRFLWLLRGERKNSTKQKYGRKPPQSAPTIITEDNMKSRLSRPRGGLLSDTVRRFPLFSRRVNNTINYIQYPGSSFSRLACFSLT